MVASETRWTARPYAAVRMVVFRALVGLPRLVEGPGGDLVQARD